jgi:hypothetical protein
MARGNGRGECFPGSLELQQWELPGPARRQLTCEHNTRRLTRTEYDGTITVLMDRQEHESSPDGKARTPCSITKAGGQGKPLPSNQRRSVSLTSPFIEQRLPDK